LLRCVAPLGAAGRVSGLSIAALHVGAVIVLFMAFIGFMAPPVGWFGITHTLGGVARAVAVLCAVWFAVFALLMVLLRLSVVVPDDPAPVRNSPGWIMVYRQLWHDLKDLQQHGAHMLDFLLANALYQDGLAAVFVFVPVLAFGSFGVGPAELLLFEVAIMMVG